MIIRVAHNKENPYKTLNTTGFKDDSRLSFKARGILAYLLSQPDCWEIYVDNLINAGPDGRESVRSGLKELETYGYLERERINDEGGKYRWISVVYEVPRNIPSEKENQPSTGFPSMVQPSMENPSIHELSNKDTMYDSKIRNPIREQENKNSDNSGRTGPSTPHRISKAEQPEDEELEKKIARLIAMQTRTPQQQQLPPTSEKNNNNMPAASQAPRKQVYSEDRQIIGSFIQDYARELNDKAPLSSSISRAVNLYRRSGLSLDEFVNHLNTARAITQERSASIKAIDQADKNRPFTPKKKMPYFFACLEDQLGLKE